MQAEDFNPHFHKGSDIPIIPWTVAVRISIHTSTREVTQAYFPCYLIALYFNPHFHKGSDKLVLETRQEDFISIHTSTREVTGIDGFPIVIF